MNAARGIFFAVGWVLFQHVDLLPALGRNARRDIALALLLLPLSGLVLRFRSLDTPPGSFGPLPPGAETSLAVGSVVALSCLKPGSGRWGYWLSSSWRSLAH
ncbi:MAG: hypothetical protein ABSH35_18045 [Isosphaeraceae bacterium]|jgi:hypothetical protein